MTAKIKTFIIPDPNDKLKIIYEVDKLVNILDIRAEKFYSREWKEELLALEAKWNKDKAENKLSVHEKDKQFTAPLNVHNPNHAKIVKLIDAIHSLKKDKDKKPTGK